MKDTFYPEIQPYETGMLRVDTLHQMYWEISGNPKGVPVVVVHGGPGAGSSNGTRRFFDPDYYRIIQFDQRGSGKSTPYAEIKDNTTPHLIADMEALRQHLQVDKWYLFGGSWGSTLSLAYAEAYPERCLGLILRGIFLCRRSEFDWLLYGMQSIFPAENRKLREYISEAERGDLLKAYYQRLIHPDPEIHIPAAKIWSWYEGVTATLLPNPAVVKTFDEIALSIARIEAHYFVNDIFLPENDLLNKIDRIRHIPGVIVQGRYDMVCPIISADDLVQKWPEVEYRIVDDAGHSAFEPGTAKELVMAMERFKHI